VKLPLPEDRAEAFAVAGSRNRGAIRGSAANADFRTFIVPSFRA
jgi:hypothetical protein